MKFCITFGLSPGGKGGGGPRTDLFLLNTLGIGGGIGGGIIFANADNSPVFNCFLRVSNAETKQ